MKCQCSTRGSGGRVTLAGVDVGQGLERQADGKFVLVGSVTEATVPATARFLIECLNADGSPDPSFGKAGTVDTAFTVSAVANAVALQRDGKIVAAGASVFSANANFVVARYHADGSVDRSFGDDGNLSIDFFGSDDVAESVLVQSDGKIVVGAGVALAAVACQCAAAGGLARNQAGRGGVARIDPGSPMNGPEPARTPALLPGGTLAGRLPSATTPGGADTSIHERHPRCIASHLSQRCSPLFWPRRSLRWRRLIRPSRCG